MAVMRSLGERLLSVTVGNLYWALGSHRAGGSRQVSGMSALGLGQPESVRPLLADSRLPPHSNNRPPLLAFCSRNRGVSLPGFGRHLVNGFCFSLRWRAVAIERVQALAIVKDLDVVKHLGLHLLICLMVQRQIKLAFQ